jgi:biotin carboxylase
MGHRILMLGGSVSQLPALRRAHDLGYEVILCDYLPDNPGQKFADQYLNVSSTDLEAVLQVARDRRIDGIVAYASDPAAATAAYVGNALGLPSNPYQSVSILTRKDLFRRFLTDNGFNAPNWRSCATLDEARRTLAELVLPVVVKPVDSSGSRGVTVIDTVGAIDTAFTSAMGFARYKCVIIEEFIRTDYAQLQMEGDGFVVDGRLVFRAFCDGNFDLLANPLVPFGVTFPSVYAKEVQDRAHAEIQRVIDALKMRHGALNFDIRVGSDGRVFLLEIGPRNGGNLLPVVIERATGVDLIDYTFRSALGLDCSDLRMADIKGNHASFVIHARQDGILRQVSFSDEIERRIKFKDVWCKPGQQVYRFDGSHRALGNLLLEFDSFAQMRSTMEHMDRHVTVSLA